MLGVFGPTYSVTNQLEASDQISWSHGKHTIRAGYEYEDTRWPIIWSGVRGLLLTGTFNDLLVGGAGQSPLVPVLLAKRPGGHCPRLCVSQHERIRSGRLEGQLALDAQPGRALGIQRGTER